MIHSYCQYCSFLHKCNDEHEHLRFLTNNSLGNLNVLLEVVTAITKIMFVLSKKTNNFGVVGDAFTVNPHKPTQTKPGFKRR